ncbi:MAG TPA: hypothetical protein VFA46_17670 [Actinomycetes bacterium]|nr:hypothetical protein [Actinomycetes bacterium]
MDCDAAVGCHAPRDTPVLRWSADALTEGLVNHGKQLGRECGQIEFVAQTSAERLDGLAASWERT